MKIATKEDIDKFMAWAINDKTIYPFLSTSKHIREKEPAKTDWERLIFISECGKCLLHIEFDRCRDIEFSISLYAKSPILAGRAIQVVKEVIKRYDPRAINSVVHHSNIKSRLLHDKVFSTYWGIERSGAWNMGLGEYEDLYYYRMLL